MSETELVNKLLAALKPFAAEGAIWEPTDKFDKSPYVEASDSVILKGVHFNVGTYREAARVYEEAAGKSPLED
jgi:hypothetical protein